MENGVSHKYNLKSNLFKGDFQRVIVTNNSDTFFSTQKTISIQYVHLTINYNNLLQYSVRKMCSYLGACSKQQHGQTVNRQWQLHKACRTLQAHCILD